MFIYGLYAIESHKCDHQQSDVEKAGKVYNRQKSYSISEGNKIIPSYSNQNSKLKSFNYAQLDQHQNNAKYTQNLMQFENYIERLSKQAEQEKLNNFLKQNGLFDKKSAQYTNNQTILPNTVLNKRRNTSFVPRLSNANKDMVPLNRNDLELIDVFKVDEPTSPPKTPKRVNMLKDYISNQNKKYSLSYESSSHHSKLARRKSTIDHVLFENIEAERNNDSDIDFNKRKSSKQWLRTIFGKIQSQSCGGYG